MPRHPRLFLPYAIYHVDCRVARGEFVFDDDNEAIEFVEVPREVRNLDGWTILARCLMATHSQYPALSSSLFSIGNAICIGARL